MQGVGRTLMIGGATLFLLGLLLTVGGRLGLGRLPGDIAVRRGSFAFFFPLGTSLLLSILLTLLLNVLVRLWGRS